VYRWVLQCQLDFSQLLQQFRTSAVQGTVEAVRTFLHHSHLAEAMC
jgi:hypothetical protein